MPNFAVYKERLITTEDIYKFNIEKSNEFTCYNCNKQVHFRQKRNMENSFTEHFYHPNTVKDTHIECENLTLDKVKDVDTWHNKFSNFIEVENREVVAKAWIDDAPVVAKADPANPGYYKYSTTS